MGPTSGPWRLGPDCDILAGDTVVLRDRNARLADLVLAASAPDLAQENAALRKRVEELESERLKGLRLAYELTPDCQTVEAYASEARAEKAERERDEAMRNHGECGMALSAVVGERDKLQADLDAALLVIKEARVRPELSWSDEALSTFSRIDLSKAEAKRG